ncbi:MAG: porin family protein [Saprospiraceae bacterium]
MQADQNNYQPDKQFTDKGWDDMLKTLDKEMPVQEKKRRGFLWLFPLLLIGVIASVWAFYPQVEKTEIAQSQEVNFDQNQNSETASDKNNLELINESIVNENQTIKTTNPLIENNKSKNDEGFPSIIEFSNPLLPQVIEEIVPVEEIENSEPKASIAKLKEEIKTINPSFITLQLQNQENLLIAEKEFFFKEEIIIKDPNPTKRKREFGVFAGVVTDFANLDKVGLTSGGFVHFPIRKKLGFRTGLGYSQLQKDLSYSFIGNQNALLSSGFIDVTAASPPPFSTVAVQSNTDFILEKFHQLDLPVLLTYSPVKKMQIQLGANASFLIKEKTRLIDSSIEIDQSVNDDYSNYGIELDVLDLNSISQNQYSDENYWTKLNVNGVVGLAWKPTRRINLELQYHHGFFPILKSSRDRNSDNSQAIIPSSTSTLYEVFNNSVDLSSAERSSIQSFFKRDRFIENNHSLRLTIGYNF